VIPLLPPSVTTPPVPWEPGDLSPVLLLGNETGLLSNTARYFNAANDESLSITDNASISVGDIDFWWAGWVYLDSTGTLRYFAGQYAASGNQRSWGLSFSTANPAVSTVLMSSNGSTFTSATGPTITAAGWHLVMVYHDAANDLIGISVDNSAFTTTAHSGGCHDSTAAFMLGDLASATTGWLGRMQMAAFGKSPTETFDNIRDALWNGGAGLDLADVTAQQISDWGGVSAWRLTENSGGAEDIWGTNDLTDNNTVTAEVGHVAYDSSADDYVATAEDAGAEGADMTQAAFEDRPQVKTVNGRTVLLGDGVSDFLSGSCSLVQPLHIFIVGIGADSGTLQTMAGELDSAEVYIEESGTDAGYDAGGTAKQAAHTPGAWHLYEVFLNGASSYMKVDGASLATGDAGSAGVTTTLGLMALESGVNPLAGHIDTLIACDAEVTGADLDDLDAWVEDLGHSITITR